MLFRGSTLDDVLFRIFRSLNRSKRAHSINTTRGDCRELIGTLIRVDDPRARMSIAALRSQLFSCLGELFWYLSGSNKTEHITYYVPKYVEESQDGITINSAYGPRLFKMKGVNQAEEIVSILRRKPSSRRAVIQIFDSTDLAQEKSPPCTCFLQFLVRGYRLNLFVSMRSNDAYLGLPHDMFAFSMIQEIVARELDLELGTYTHAVGSLHLYEEHVRWSQRYLDEGYQERSPMPPMPSGTPRAAIHKLIEFERRARIEGPGAKLPTDIDEYWLDLARLLSIYSCYKRKQLAELERLRGEMFSKAFDFAIERRARQLTRRPRQEAFQEPLFKTTDI